MRILCCLNRDLASNSALNLLLPTLARHQVRIGLTERVGAPPQNEPPARAELRLAEQQFPNEVLFPLLERATLPDDGVRHLTFAEIERNRGIRVEPLPDPNAPAALDLIRAFAPDLILTIRYGAILKAPLIAIPKFGVLNLHSGRLPDYRGVLATFRALLNGDAHIGCTLHYIRDAGIDTGDVVGSARIAVDPRQSLLWHILAVYPTGIELVRTAIQQLDDGAMPAATMQSPGDGAYYSYPTADEWALFARRGWQVARPQDLMEISRRYLP